MIGRSVPLREHHMRKSVFLFGRRWPIVDET